ncbi:hypothetical protein EDD53_2672 [Pacificibacter maritimus]|uniref:Uncharacterized protein n=1 Tax=Pacificibacter maritimus TaxID=762213 RepID=A0A3N4UCQ5_9RHOB|nr:hypothetical protein [Pacificibacter maritimus]RPE63077.1 hypothetical protein EDD53_2672 [Pacificibacter maritimus]
MSFFETVIAAAIGFLIARILDAFAFRGRSSVSQVDYDIKEIRESIFEIRTLANTYWAIDGSDESAKKLEASINGRLSYVGTIIRHLFDSQSASLKAVETDLNRFHEAVTGGKYGQLNRTPDLNRIASIEMTCFSFLHKVEKCKRKLPKPLFV